MDTVDLRLFADLAASLHFGQTARRLALSPSAISRRLKGLEEELGVVLLERETRDPELTRAGELFRQFAQEELERLEQLRSELAEATASPEGELRVACTVTACHSVLPRLLADCRTLYPKISLKLITQDAERSLAQLDAGEVELAVIPTDERFRGDFLSTPLASTALSFIGPRDEALLRRLGTDLPSLLAEETTASAKRVRKVLANVPFVAQLGGLERRRLNDWLKRYDLLPLLAAEVRGNEGIIAMVSLGSGLGLVPNLVLDKSPVEVSRLSALPSPKGYDVSLCTRRRSITRSAVKAFWDLAGPGREA